MKTGADVWIRRRVLPVTVQQDSMETGVKTTSTNAEIIPAQTAEAAWTWSTDTCACVSRDIPEVRVKST